MGDGIKTAKNIVLNATATNVQTTSKTIAKSSINSANCIKIPPTLKSNKTKNIVLKF